MAENKVRKCDWEGCERDSITFGNIHDNITDKRFRVWTCKEHTENIHDMGLAAFNHVVMHEVSGDNYQDV